MLYMGRQNTCPRSNETTKTGKELSALSIASDIIRGHTDTIILAHLSRGDSYGYEINKSIQKHTQGLYELKEATLYTAFRRLEENGCITSYWGNEKTGARRRYYSLTSTGQQTYIALVEEWGNARELIDKLIYLEGKQNGG